MNIALKRIYEPAAPEDGCRVLVERLWPRGMTKADAALDRWLKEIAPSPELRRWYAHDRERWQEFVRRYREELTGRTEELEWLTRQASSSPVTLLFASRDPEMCSARVLRDYLQEWLASARP